MSRLREGRGRLGGFGPISAPTVTAGRFNVNTDIVLAANAIINGEASGTYIKMRNGSAGSPSYRFTLGDNYGFWAGISPYISENAINIVSGGSTGFSVTVNTRAVMANLLNAGGFSATPSAKTAAFTFDPEISVYRVDCTAGAVPGQLPAAGTSSARWFILNESQTWGVNNFSLVPNGTDEIDGANSTQVFDNTVNIVIVQGDGEGRWNTLAG